jgi:DNA-binding MarR family transcriptional regulator
MSQGEPGIELDTSLGYLLKAAASALHSALDAVLRPLGMTITHYACLELLAQRPGLSNSELARGAFVTRQSMNVLLQALERQGLVIRPAQAPAGRALPTELTARGRRQLKVASAAVRRVEQDMLANLDASEQDQMRRLLTACIAALTEPPASATQPLRNLRLCHVPDLGPTRRPWKKSTSSGWPGRTQRHNYESRACRREGHKPSYPAGIVAKSRKIGR